jgi:hypothetical protein
MDDVFNFIFERELRNDKDEKRKKSGGDFKAAGEFNPDDANYDPQTRLKRRLRMLFPHMPGLPGLPPRTNEQE